MRHLWLQDKEEGVSGFPPLPPPGPLQGREPTLTPRNPRIPSHEVPRRTLSRFANFPVEFAFYPPVEGGPGFVRGTILQGLYALGEGKA